MLLFSHPIFQTATRTLLRYTFKVDKPSPSHLPQTVSLVQFLELFLRVQKALSVQFQLPRMLLEGLRVWNREVTLITAANAFRQEDNDESSKNSSSYQDIQKQFDLLNQTSMNSSFTVSELTKLSTTHKDLFIDQTRVSNVIIKKTIFDLLMAKCWGVPDIELLGFLVNGLFLLISDDSSVVLKSLNEISSLSASFRKLFDSMRQTYMHHIQRKVTSTEDQWRAWNYTRMNEIIASISLKLSLLFPNDQRRMNECLPRQTVSSTTTKATTTNQLRTSGIRQTSKPRVNRLHSEVSPTLLAAAPPTATAKLSSYTLQTCETLHSRQTQPRQNIRKQFNEDRNWLERWLSASKERPDRVFVRLLRNKIELNQQKKIQQLIFKAKEQQHFEQTSQSHVLKQLDGIHSGDDDTLLLHQRINSNTNLSLSNIITEDIPSCDASSLDQVEGSSHYNTSRRSFAYNPHSNEPTSNPNYHPVPLPNRKQMNQPSSASLESPWNSQRICSSKSRSSVIFSAKNGQASPICTTNQLGFSQDDESIRLKGVVQKLNTLPVNWSTHHTSPVSTNSSTIFHNASLRAAYHIATSTKPSFGSTYTRRGDSGGGDNSKGKQKTQTVNKDWSYQTEADTSTSRKTTKLSSSLNFDKTTSKTVSMSSKFRDSQIERPALKQSFHQARLTSGSIHQTSFSSLRPWDD